MQSVVIALRVLSILLCGHENGSESLQIRAGTLFLGEYLPYFPGKMGVDFFNLRYLSQTHRVIGGGTKARKLPMEGIANLEKTALGLLSLAKEDLLKRQ